MPATKLHLDRTRRLLDQFRWVDLFVDELGWNQAPSGTTPLLIKETADTYTLQPVARLGGAWVYVVSSPLGIIPDAKARLNLHKATVSRQREHLLIFEDGQQQQTLWSWPRYEGGSIQARTHLYVKGQPGDLFLSKLSNIYFDLSELDDRGEAELLTVTNRLKKALDVRPVTREFYKVFSQQQHNLVAEVQGLPDEPRRRHYASVLLTRLMFVYFLQKKELLDNRNGEYLERKLEEHLEWASTQPGTPPTFYRRFLRELFFQGFALAPEHRSPAATVLLGTIPYLNGGLFLPHALEQGYKELDLPDEAVQNLLSIFTSFSWNLNDSLGGKDNEINPDVLGYIFEKYINSNSSKQKGAGAFYTPTEITTYLCDQTVDGLLLRACNTTENQQPATGVKAHDFRTLDELLLHLDDGLAKKLLQEVLPNLSLLDPACGSGAFLVAALKKLETVYAAVVGYVKVSASDTWLKNWLHKAEQHANLGYFIKKEIITRNLFGVDLMDEAVEIARLRLFLALVAAAQKPEDLEPLPNIDFNLMEGNGLVGLLRIQEEDFRRYSRQDLFAPHYKDLLSEKNRLIDRYKGLTEGDAVADTAMTSLRDEIQEQLNRDRNSLTQVLHANMQTAKIGFQQARWDSAKGKESYTKRPLTTTHVQELRPFHWGYEFDRVLERGGFDAIIANPPWEVFKPNAKEFFEEYSEVVQRNVMRLEDFEAQKSELLASDPALCAAWEDYLSRFPYVSELFRQSPDYSNQTSTVAGKRTSSDLNLYKLFLERCYQLLRNGGQCGIVIPSGIYTDLGTKGLREMLFSGTTITGLFGFENRRGIFEDVHKSFKFVVLSFEKGDPVDAFPATFMRLDVEDMARFPDSGAMWLDVEMVRRLSPESLSIMEFRTPIDKVIAEKMAVFPSLGGSASGNWGLRFTREFDMTLDSKGLFEPKPQSGRVALYEGKMMHQFTHQFASPRYWVDIATARKRVLGQRADIGQTLDYQTFRLGFRDIARNTDERTLISTVLPPQVFHGNKLPTVRVFDENGTRLISNVTQLYLCGVWNSFTLDWLIRKSVTTTLNYFYLYQLPVPRLESEDPRFIAIARITAQLICTTPEFDELAQSAGLSGHTDAVTDAGQRVELRAELDAIVAHVYGLSDVEFAHVLENFPIVKAATKAATLAAFRAKQSTLLVGLVGQG